MFSWTDSPLSYDLRSQTLRWVMIWDSQPIWREVSSIRVTKLDIVRISDFRSQNRLIGNLTEMMVVSGVLGGGRVLKNHIRVSLDRSRITQIGVQNIDIRLPKIQKGKNVQSRFWRVCSSVTPKWIRFSKSTANSTHPRWSRFFLETENWRF